MKALARGSTSFDWSKKLEKSLKKYLTKASECVIIFELPKKRHITSKLNQENFSRNLKKGIDKRETV